LKMELKIIGIEYGEFEGRNWARCHILQRIRRDRGDGWKPVLDKDKKPLKMDYSLAMNLLGDWELYENQKVSIGCDPYARVITCELAG